MDDNFVQNKHATVFVSSYNLYSEQLIGWRIFNRIYRIEWSKQSYKNTSWRSEGPWRSYLQQTTVIEFLDDIFLYIPQKKYISLNFYILTW